MSDLQQSTATETLRQSAVQAVLHDHRARVALGVLAFVLATSIGAQVAVPLPLTPVPMTLQPVFVILAGAVLGPWAGAAAMATYLALGISGVPVFSAGHAGIVWLMGPTGGYLIACPAAAATVGLVAGVGRAGTARLAVALVAGLAVLYVGGVSQLLLLTGGGLREVVALGVVPFLGGDLIKVLIALVLTKGIRIRSLGRR